MYTTLNQIRACHPCGLKPINGVYSGLCLLMRNLGKTTTDDEPVTIMEILESNGIDDALWCLQAVDGYEREKRLLAVDFARMSQHLADDPAACAAVIDVAERYANGLATDDELARARARASASASDWASAWAWASARARARASASASDWASAWAWASDWAWASARASASAWASARASASASDWAWASAWASASASALEDKATLLCIVCAEIEQRDD